MGDDDQAALPLARGTPRGGRGRRSRGRSSARRGGAGRSGTAAAPPATTVARWPPDSPRRRDVEQALGEAEVGEHRPHRVRRSPARRGRGSARGRGSSGRRRSASDERRPDRPDRPWAAPDLAARRAGGRLQQALSLADAGAPEEQVAQGLAGDELRLLGQVADRGRRRAQHDPAGVGRLETGEDAQQRRLADAVRPDDTDPVARADASGRRRRGRAQGRATC